MIHTAFDKAASRMRLQGVVKRWRGWVDQKVVHDSRMARYFSRSAHRQCAEVFTQWERAVRPPQFAPGDVSSELQKSHDLFVRLQETSMGDELASLQAEIAQLKSSESQEVINIRRENKAQIESLQQQSQSSIEQLRTQVSSLQQSLHETEHQRDENVLKWRQLESTLDAERIAAAAERDTYERSGSSLRSEQAAATAKATELEEAMLATQKRCDDLLAAKNAELAEFRPKCHGVPGCPPPALRDPRSPR